MKSVLGKYSLSEFVLQGVMASVSLLSAALVYKVLCSVSFGVSADGVLVNTSYGLVR